jgi:MoaA/NifB/PqqE/SkfB family radical SAM enzyme
MFELGNVTQLHLEVTSQCNASCPMCARNVRGGEVNPNMPITELSLADIQVILPQKLVRQFKHVYLCGNYGDASVARDTLEILRYLRSANPELNLGMHTNGSARKPEWWAELAQSVSYVMFGIDGLEDTNHLYRKNVVWRQLMRNVAAFIEAGGKAEWEFIVFEHNEHQIDQATLLSRQMGFSAFRLRYTSRFLFKSKYYPELPVLDNRGQMEYSLRPPKHEQLLNPAITQISKLMEDGVSHEEYLDSTKITCQALEDQKIFVSAEGLVFPCCFTAHIYPWHEKLGENQVFKLLMENGGKSSLDARVRTIPEIISDRFFKAVVESWQRPAIKGGKLRVCSEICGECRTVKSQYTASRI